MQLNELKSPFEKKRVIMYNFKGDKAIYHNKNVQHISGSLYCGETIQDEYKEYCDLFVFYDNILVGLWIGTVRTNDTVEEVMDMLNRIKMDTLEKHKANIEYKITNDQYFRLIEIEFGKHIDPKLEDQMWESRKNYGINQDKIERERREKRYAEDQAYIQQRNDEAQQLVDQAVAILKSGNGILDNYNVTIYKTRYHARAYSIINYLARKYGVEIPIKTQGWINDKLTQVILENGECKRCRYQSKKNSKCSTKIFGYVDQLIKAIQDQEV